MDEICGETKTRTFTAPSVRRGVRKEGRAEREARLQHAFLEYADSGVPGAERIPEPPFFGSAIVDSSELDLMTVLRYVNKKALYRLQWQYRKGKRPVAEYQEFVNTVVEPKFKEWCKRVVEDKLLAPKVLYGYFPCASEQNDLIVYDPDTGAEKARFTFPRQPRNRRLCISDFFRKSASGERDVVAFTLVTMGAVATETSEALFKADRYDEYLHFHGLSVEGTEALAEYWHKRVRQQLGIADQDDDEVEGLFHQRYQGSRYSFGYPACPDLEDQTKLWPLLDPARIGVALSDEFQLVPEQSTSALVCHHPAAKYFNVTV
jgi:5-methyltetrahydrofolate--homocysteine methyltransferase